MYKNVFDIKESFTLAFIDRYSLLICLRKCKKKTKLACTRLYIEALAVKEVKISKKQIYPLSNEAHQLSYSSLF